MTSRQSQTQWPAFQRLKPPAITHQGHELTESLSTYPNHGMVLASGDLSQRNSTDDILRISESREGAIGCDFGLTLSGDVEFLQYKGNGFFAWTPPEASFTGTRFRNVRTCQRCDLPLQVQHEVDEILRESQFRALVNRWHEETDGHSSPTRIVSNPTYLTIIALGKPVLPLILSEMEKNGGYWYPALKAISNENPVPDSARGKPRLIREAWLDWGRKNNLI